MVDSWCRNPPPLFKKSRRKVLQSLQKIINSCFVLFFRGNGQKLLNGGGGGGVGSQTGNAVWRGATRETGETYFLRSSETLSSTLFSRCCGILSGWRFSPGSYRWVSRWGVCDITFTSSDPSQIFKCYKGKEHFYGFKEESLSSCHWLFLL